MVPVLPASLTAVIADAIAAPSIGKMAVRFGCAVIMLLKMSTSFVASPLSYSLAGNVILGKRAAASFLKPAMTWACDGWLAGRDRKPTAADGFLAPRESAISAPTWALSLPTSVCCPSAGLPVLSATTY